MAKLFPLTLIDIRKDKKHPYEYITVTDKALAFVARILEFYKDEDYRNFYKTAQEHKDFEIKYMSYDFGKGREGGFVVEVVHFFYEFPKTTQNTKRIRSLMKRAINKYVHNAVDRAIKFSKEIDLDTQITQMKETIQRAKSNYSQLLERVGNDRKSADWSIAVAEATLQSLETLKQQEERAKHFE